jgi:hypothetical protein
LEIFTDDFGSTPQDGPGTGAVSTLYKRGSEVGFLPSELGKIDTGIVGATEFRTIKSMRQDKSLFVLLEQHLRFNKSPAGQRLRNDWGTQIDFVVIICAKPQLQLGTLEDYPSDRSKRHVLRHCP